MQAALNLSSTGTEIVNNMILISGMPRTGTTILGKIIGSFQHVDYHFEPPLFRTIFPQVYKRDISREAFKSIFETYCYEDLLLGHLSGRKINLNEHDDSYILKMVAKSEINYRLSKSFRKYELERIAPKYKLAIKIPGSLTYFNTVTNIFPDITTIITYRSPLDVLASVVKKKWYNDISLNSLTVFFPYRINKANKIPYAIPEELDDEFIASNEYDRAAISYFCEYNQLFDIRRAIVVDYNTMVENTTTVIKKLSEQIGNHFGENTHSLIKTVQKVKRDNSNIGPMLSKKWNDKIHALDEKIIQSDLFI